MIFSSLLKRRGATPAGVFGLALSCVLLFCGAGSVPVENLLPQGAMQGDLNAGGHNLTNAATVYATAVSATSVSVSGTLTAPAGFTLPFSQLTGTPTTLSGYGITNAEPALGNPSTNGYVLSSTTGGTRSWIAAGGPLTLDSSVTAAGFSYGSPTAGTLYLANVNGANGLVQFNGNSAIPIPVDGSASGLRFIQGSALYEDSGGNLNLTGGSGQITANSPVSAPVFSAANFTLNTNAVGAMGGLAALTSSDGTADDSLSLLGTTDDGFRSIAIGGGSSATLTGIAIGAGANTSTGCGTAIGENASSTFAGVAIGSHSGPGTPTTETGGGVEFLGGSYAGTGVAIHGDEIALPNGSGYSTLSGCDDSTTPTNTSTPVGWIHVHVNGADSWIPYYQ